MEKSRAGQPQQFFPYNFRAFHGKEMAGAVDRNDAHRRLDALYSPDLQGFEPPAARPLPPSAALNDEAIVSRETIVRGLVQKDLHQQAGGAC